MSDKIKSTETSLHLSQQALDFYHLKKQPFSNKMLSDNDTFKDAIFEQLIDNIHHHLQFTELVLILEGAENSGKSTLFRQLIKSKLKNLLIIPTHAEASDNFHRIKQKISLHLDDQNSEIPLQEKLKNLQVFDQHAALVIDDSHLLNDETLQKLFSFKQSLLDESVLLHILFIAENGFSERLDATNQLQQEQIFIQQTPELTNKQTAAFINHCFSRAGCTNEVEFNNNDTNYILNFSKGNIGNIMPAAASLLNKRIKQLQSPSIKAVSKTYLLPLSLLLILAIVFALIQSDLLDSSNEKDDLLTLNTDASNHTIIKEKNTSKEPKLNTHSKAAKSIINTPVEITATQKKVSQSEAPPITKVISIGDHITENDAQITDYVDKTPKKKPSIETTISTIKSTPVSTNTNSLPKEVLNEPEDITRTQQITNTSSNTKKPQLNDSLVKLSQLGVHDANWLMQQNKGYWTLQILGARSPATLLKFVINHKLSDDTAWYKTKLKQKPWYVLVHRLYSNRETARRSILTLSTELQKKQPWAKSLASIHKSIKK